MNVGRDCAVNPNCKNPAKKKSLSLDVGRRIWGEATGRSELCRQHTWLLSDLPSK